LARDKGKIEMACGGHEERSSILQRLSVSHHREAQQSSTNVHTFSPGTMDCDDGRVHAFPLQQLLCGGTHVPVPATSANLPPPRVETGQGNWQIVGSLRQFAIFCGLLGSLSLSPLSQALWPGVKRRSPVLAFSWPQDNTTSLSHPVVPMRALSKAAPGLWVFVPWIFGLVGGLRQSPPVLVHVLVPDERRGGRSPAMTSEISGSTDWYCGGIG
jgi:hypothetical protein